MNVLVCLVCVTTLGWFWWDEGNEHACYFSEHDNMWWYDEVCMRMYSDAENMVVHVWDAKSFYAWWYKHDCAFLLMVVHCKSSQNPEERF